MSWVKSFVRSVLWVEVAAIVGLLFVGLMLTWGEDARNGYSFFSYRIQHLDFIPAWFAGVLALMSVNGFWAFRLSVFEGAFNTPPRSGWGPWGASVPINPLRLFAINLVAIPVIIAAFLVIRSNAWWGLSWTGNRRPPECFSTS